MKRVLYVLRKICLLIEAIINITNNKKYWRKYYIYKYCRKYYKCDRKYHKNIQNFMNMRESIVKIFKFGRKPALARDNCVAITPLNKLRKYVLSRNDLKLFEITENQME